MVVSSEFPVVKDDKTADCHLSSTSGIMVADRHGDIFISAASHSFGDDGLVYHPDPKTGNVIETVVENIKESIAIVRLKSGIRYTNEIFGNGCMAGTRITRIAPGLPPHSRVGDTIFMNNPFSGYCEGTVMALGAKVEGCGSKHHVKHIWSLFENGTEPIQGSCGSAILDKNGQVVAFFRFQQDASGFSVGVSAVELRESGYEVCDGIQKF
jgi:hypothetical protein